MIRKQIDVGVPPEDAFAAWTEAMHLWWPPGHKRSGDRAARMIVEGHIGGRLYERAGDGRELEVGVVLSWEPPRRLAHTFVLGTGADHPSHVEVQFTPIAGGTRVEVVHRPGSAGERFDRAQTRFVANWAAVLGAFGRHF